MDDRNLLQARRTCRKPSPSVEMPTDTPGVFRGNQVLRRITSFRFSYIADSCLCFIPGITNALRLKKENTNAQRNEQPGNTDPTRLPCHNQQRNRVRPYRERSCGSGRKEG